jgi:PhoH-like ATPase
MLDKLRAGGTLSRGVPLEGGGMLKVDVAAHSLDIGILSADKHKADNQILACARELLHTCKERVVLVSKDTNLRIKADAIGVQAEDYTTDRVEMDELYTGHKSWEVDPAKVDLLYDGGLQPDPDLRLQPNQFLTLVDQTNASHTALARFMAGEGLLRPLKRMEAWPWGIKPRNREQQFAMELLLDPAVQVVTLLGKAGTGKTLLAIAAGLQLVVDDEAYDKILVSRPVMPMGRDLGYLPGDISEKLRPYMQPIYDNLEFIVGANSEARKRTTMTAGQLEEAGYLAVEPLTYIRGRSIPRQYLVVDEAQNLTPHEVKTILTRAGEGTKVIFTGDPHQIDNPYVDASTNGLSFLAEHFKQLDISGHVTLQKGERSKLAELASNLL